MRFITCRLPDGVEDPAILSADGRQVWPLSWLGLSYETLSDAIPFLTPQVRAGLSLAIAGIPALPIEAVTPESPIPSPAQDVICLGINYMAHSDEAKKYSADAFATKHQDAIYFSKRVTRAVPDGGFIEAHTDLVKKLDYEGRSRRADERLRLRLHHPERCLRPGCPDRPQAVVFRQEPRRLHSHRPLYRHGGRVRHLPAQAPHPVLRQRRKAAGLQHRPANF